MLVYWQKKTLHIFFVKIILMTKYQKMTFGK